MGIRVGLLAATCGSAVLAGVASAQEAPADPDALVRSGFAALERGDADEAAQAFAAALAAEPDSAPALRGRGRVRAARGEPEAALADLGRAIELRPNYAWAYVDRARLRWDRGEAEAALADADRAVEFAPSLAAARLTRARLRLGAGEPEAAAADVERALALAPESAAAHHLRAELRWGRDEVDAALADADRAVALAPERFRFRYDRAYYRYLIDDNEPAVADCTRLLARDDLSPRRRADVLRLRGLARYDAGEPAEAAMADLDAAVAAAPEETWYVAQRARFAQRIGDLEAAAADLLALAGREPEAGWAQDAAWMWYDAGRYADALAALDRAPPDAIRAYVRGRVLAAQGGAEAAGAAYARALELDPDHPGARLERARLAIEQGRARSAVEDLEALTERYPDWAEPFELLGDAQADRGQLRAAAAAYARVTDLDPENADGWAGRGWSRYQLGDYAGARADYDRVIELAPDYAPNYYWRALARAGAGDRVAALADLDRAHDLDPSDPDVLYERAWLHFDQDDADAALSDMNAVVALDPAYPDAQSDRAFLWVWRHAVPILVGCGFGLLVLLIASVYGITRLAMALKARAEDAEEGWERLDEVREVARGALRCAVCHDDLDGAALRCGGCATLLHPACREGGEACPTAGCEGVLGLEEVQARSPLLTLWYRPRPTLRRVLARDGGAEGPAFVIAAAAGAGEALGRLAGSELPAHRTLLEALPPAVGVGAVGGLITLFVWSALLAWTGSLFDGRATAGQLRAAVGWSRLPRAVALAGWVAVFAIYGDAVIRPDLPADWRIAVLLGVGFLSFVLAIWSLVLSILLVAEVQGFSAAHSVGNHVVAAVPLLLLCGCAVGAVVAGTT